MTRRTIFKRAGSAHAARLLQSVFACEYVAPSSLVTIVSPWISDMPLLDNRAGGFQGLQPDWPAVHVPLSGVLIGLAERGVEVRVLTRPRDSTPMLDKLRALAEARSAPLFVRTGELTLHAKGIAGDHYRILGSMNLTTSGVMFNDEQLEYSSDPEDVAEARRNFDELWRAATQ
jgi:hypothetical protein